MGGGVLGSGRLGGGLSYPTSPHTRHPSEDTRGSWKMGRGEKEGMRQHKISSNI